MDDISSHVSLKIRSAIKAKLMELGTYVDNELPDYIMVLVVNKKTKEQMDNDLSLFLGHNTEHFTSWLTDVLEKLNMAAAANRNNCPIVAPPPPPADTFTNKPAEKEKDIKLKVDVKVPDTTSKDDSIKKSDTTLQDNSIKENKEKDKAKSKDRKLEKKEKKRKKKEKKELEKKLKKEAKEAKKKATLEVQEKLNKENGAGVEKQGENKILSDVKYPSPEVKSSVESSETTDSTATPVTIESKRKRSDSSDDSDGVKEPLHKRSIVEAVGKDKTLIIRKTIHNDHHKPATALVPEVETKQEENKTTSAATVTKKQPTTTTTTAADDATIAAASTTKSKKPLQKPTQLKSKPKKTIVAKVVVNEPEEDVEQPDEDIESNDRFIDDEKEEHEEEEIEEEEIEEEEEEEEEEDEEEEEEEIVEDIVHMKVDASDELEQELQEDVEEERAAAAAAASKQAHDKSSKSNKSSKPNSHRTSSSSSKHRTKGVSVMDRLGPPRHNKRPRSGSEDLDRRRESLNHRNGSPNHRHDVPNGKHVEPNSKHEAPKSKRRVVNLLEESSFPPRRSEKKSSSSSSRSDKKTLSSKGRVRPLSVVERSGRGGGSSPRSNALASVVARQRDQGSDGTASGSEEEEELGLSQPSTAAVQSKVEVTGRDRRTNSAAGGKTRAPNTSLILRAVADAHRSVTTTSSAPKRTSTHLHDEHKPSSKKPKMEVFSRSYREREEGRLTSSSGSSSSSVAAAAAAAAAAAELKEGGKLQKLSITVPNPPRPSARKDVSSDDSDSAADRRNRSSRPGASVLSKQRLGERIEGSSLRYRVSDTMIDEIEEEHLTAEDVSRLHHHNTEPTLLLQPQPLQQMHNVDEVEEYIEEVEEWEEDVESVGTAASIDPTAGILLPATATVAAGVVAAPPINPLLMSLDELVHQNNVSSETKYTTRCIFWPACRLAEKCQYQHPTMPCKLFPNCTFGDKCLYIHPNCKYDAQCTRPDCSFTHATRSVPALNAPVIPAKSKLSLNAVPGPARATGGVMGRRCHFGLKCTNVNCPFLHPKPCKFGNACPIPGCQFTHPDFTTGSKLKWVAPKLGAANATATGAVPVATFTTTTGAVPAGVFTTATGAVPAAGFITKVDVPTASVPTTALSSSITAARPTHGSDPYVYIRKQTPVAAETTAVAAPAAENTSSNSLTESQPSDNKLTATNGCNKKAEDGVVVTLRTKKTPITVD